MVLGTVSKGFTKVFGSRNDRLVKSYRARVDAINSHESSVRQLTDGELRAKTEAFRQKVKDGVAVRSLLPEALAVAREAMDRAVGIRNIFNPETNFDPSVLPDDAQKLYAQTQAAIDKLEPQPVAGGEPAPPWMQVEIPVRLYEAVREKYVKSRPPFRARPFDVQLIGGMVLSEGKIAEMKTGEGKTIVAPLACYLACLEGLQCHIVTVNDYLVQRDRDWVFPFYYWLGLTVGAIHPFHMQPHEKKAEAYGCDALYGTNSEFGFDMLRDNMKTHYEEQVQHRRDFAIIDEVDSILIDEARTPLIISGPAHEQTPEYGLADQVARHLVQKQRDWAAADKQVLQCKMRVSGYEGEIRNARDKDKAAELKKQMQAEAEKLPALEAEREKYTQYYETELDKKAAHLTHQGVAEAQKVANIGSFYVGNNMNFAHLLENALRAHTVYQRDKDYVVQGGEVIIVDEHTGRLMVGRQWSDGLHQAVEAKEKVKIKEETQTLATVTIQNFFKMYKRLAGMTGTAATEATEFQEIYKLEVVCIPTNVPVIRQDNDDLIYTGQKDKWEAILEEIKRLHDIGLPVLVGTISVETSETLSERLRKKHGIRHEVLNAKQHEREAHIVQEAGKLGAVMIATNMAGRGTDIKLQPIDRDELVEHWKDRSLLPRQAKASMSDEALIELSYRWQAQQIFGMKEKEAKETDFATIKLSLLQHWVNEHTMTDPAKVETMTEPQCLEALDQTPQFLLHRMQMWDHVERMGGLQIIGTDRHESRRIDNQLRGRSGRQGDRGASRFIISLEDELLSRFMGKLALSALSKFGMKEGDAIEHRWLTKSVERAQRRVEEHNYGVRKNLLEWDEVPEIQRQGFYSVRQQILEGRDVDQVVFDYIGAAVDDAVDHYLARDYVPQQLAQWLASNMDYVIEPERLTDKDLDDLKQSVTRFAKDDVQAVVDSVLGEYMSDDMPPEEWDVKSLSRWAQQKYSVNLSQTQLRKMNPVDVRAELVEAAEQLIDRRADELDGMAAFLEELYPQKQLAEWARSKFGIELVPAELKDREPDQVADQILERAREAYRRREIEYPIEFTLDLARSAAQQDDGEWAAERVANWANRRYELGWSKEQVLNKPTQEMHDELVAEQEAWLKEGGKLEQLIEGKSSELRDAASARAFVTERFGQRVDDDEFEELAADELRDAVYDKGRAMLRAELTQLERFVLLQFLDSAWKDHLYALDQLKGSVSLRGYAEKDPRIEFKREGSAMFSQMQRNVRDRVTDMIFKARLTVETQARSSYKEEAAVHASAGSSLGGGSAQQQTDQAAADRAGGGEDQTMSRKQRRAAAARDRKGKSGRGGRRRRRQ